MSSWDADDWEAEDFTPTLPPASKPPGEYETAGQAILAKVNEPDVSKFEGEDAEEEAPKHSAPKPQPKKKEEKSYEKGSVPQDQPLDDPIEEKLRQQRLVEEADYRATRELFGGEDRSLDNLLPKSVKDFETYAEIMFNKYLAPHAEHKHYKLLVKQVVKLAVGPLGVQETKDLETALAGVRSDKFKAEQAAKLAASKGGKKGTLNVGKQGAAAGLDDYIYNDALDDDFDFM